MNRRVFTASLAAPFLAPGLSQAAPWAGGVVELRQYVMHPDKRDALIDLFDRAFIEPQEAAGMSVIGQFRNLDDPDSFVWLRGFADMEARRKALEAFYGGAVWQANREAANATLIDNDNVLLLKPTAEGFDLDQRGPVDATGDGPGFLAVHIHNLKAPADAAFVRFFRAQVEPMLQAAGIAPFAPLATEGSANTFPGLPVRENLPSFVWFARFADAAAYDRALGDLARHPDWAGVEGKLAGWLKRPVQRLRLTPTARSRLHG
ncbi:MAG: NIPSNAP family protein [Caulobacter sp.]